MTNEELVEEIQKGINVQANMQQLYDQNRGLIYKYVQPFTARAELEDLMQEAYFGLHKAVQNYDPEQGTRFTSYMTTWVQQTAGRYCDTCTRIIRLPVHLEGMIRKYSSFCNEYSLNHAGADPDDKTICEGIGISADQLDRIRKAILENQYVSIDSPVGEDADTDTTLGDFIPDGADLEEMILDQEQAEWMKDIWKCVDRLSASQKRVINGIFREGKIDAEVAREMNVSRQRVGQVKDAGLKKLEQMKEVNLIGCDYYDIASVAWHGGVGRFNNTWESSTESAALKELERQEMWEQWKRERAEKKAKKREMMKLPEMGITIVNMRNDGMSYRTIARILHVSPNTVRRHEIQARKTLAEDDLKGGGAVGLN